MAQSNVLFLAQIIPWIFKTCGANVAFEKKVVAQKDAFEKKVVAQKDAFEKKVVAQKDAFLAQMDLSHLYRVTKGVN